MCKKGMYLDIVLILSQGIPKFAFKATSSSDDISLLDILESSKIFCLSFSSKDLIR